MSSIPQSSNLSASAEPLSIAGRKVFGQPVHHLEHRRLLGFVEHGQVRLLLPVEAQTDLLETACALVGQMDDVRTAGQCHLWAPRSLLSGRRGGLQLY